MYYIYGISGPSLLIESTDSMIHEAKNLFDDKPVQLCRVSDRTVSTEQTPVLP